MEQTAIISAIKRFAVHDGPGIRTTAFFKGCPLACYWCHNPEGKTAGKQLAFFRNKCVLCGECARVCPVDAHEIINKEHIFHREKCVFCNKCADSCPVSALVPYDREYTPESLFAELKKDSAFYESSGGGVTLSGGEPLLHVEFLSKLLPLLKTAGISVAMDTCGCVERRAIEKVLPYVDIFLYDVKNIDGERHKAGTGRDNSLILANLEYLDSVGAKVEIRYPLIPDFNDGERNLSGAAEFLSKLKCVSGIRVLPYHNLAGSKYEALGLKNTLPGVLPTEKCVADAKNTFARFGVKVLE